MPSDQPDQTEGTGNGADIEALQKTVDQLREENEALHRAEKKSASGKGSRWRRISSWVLVVLACILAVVSVVIVFARNELLNTDAYVNTVAPLASNPAIQTQVAKQVSTRLAAATNVEQRIKNALPPKAGFLATPIASGLDTATDEITLRLVQSSAFQKIWETANRAAHKQLVAVLTGSGEGSLSSANGKVTIDLSQVEAQAKKALDAKGITVFNKVPAVKGLNFVLFQSDQLARYQRLTRLLNRVAILLPILALFCFAGGIALARDRRRGLVRAATGLALSMALVLVVVSVARNQYLNSLSPSQSRAANAAVIDTVTGALRGTLRLTLILAAVVAIVALVAGSSWVKAMLAERRLPSWVTRGPVHHFVALHRKGLQWGALGLAFVVLVVWSNPTALVAVIVVLIALALIGLVGLWSRQTPVPLVSAPGTGGGSAENPTPS
jgi:membrane-associated HD superfamily phosphohydrolase